MPEITTGDRLLLLLPFLMWLIAALLAWVLVTRLFIRPLRQLQRSVVRYEPGDAEFTLPRTHGPGDGDPGASRRIRKGGRAGRGVGA